MMEFLIRRRKLLLAAAATLVAALIVGWLAETYPPAELDGPLFAAATLVIGAVGLIAVQTALRFRRAMVSARQVLAEMAAMEARLISIPAIEAGEQAQRALSEAAQARAEAHMLRYDLDRACAEADQLRARVALAERRLAKLSIKLDMGEELKES